MTDAPDPESQESWLGPSQSNQQPFQPVIFRFDSQGGAALDGYPPELQTQYPVPIPTQHVPPGQTPVSNTWMTSHPMMTNAQSAPTGAFGIPQPHLASTINTGALPVAAQHPPPIPTQFTQPPAVQTQKGKKKTQKNSGAEGERLVHIDYLLFTQSASHEVSKTVAHRRKVATPTVPKEWDKCTPVADNVPTWHTDLTVHTWEQFKEGIIGLLGPTRKNFDRMLRAEIANGAIEWQLIYSNSRAYGHGKHFYARSEEDWEEFVDALVDHENNKVVVKLWMEDPDEKKKIIVKKQIQDDNISFNYGDEDERLKLQQERARELANPKADKSTDPVAPKILELMAHITAKFGRDDEELWISNPLDNSESMHIHNGRLKAWARALLHGKNDAIDLDHPPETPEFTWVKKRTPALDELVSKSLSAIKTPAKPTGLGRRTITPAASKCSPKNNFDGLDDDPSAEAKKDTHSDIHSELEVEIVRRDASSHVNEGSLIDDPSHEHLRDGSPARKYLRSPTGDFMGDSNGRLSFLRHKSSTGPSSGGSPPRKRPAQPAQDIYEEPNPRKLSLLGRAMSMDEFLDHCTFSASNMVPRGMIQLNHIEHWSTFLTLNVAGLMHLHFPETTARQIKYGIATLDPDMFEN
ncbi:hypothetical protein PGT21_014885 [Puccinia graminis f. sp. tritici]|uniref:Uncharacterized protein n=1 Tax=Puccinia graminis f. sp. tritici TaxID=56615 RepID=A0A5B0QB86_PUCGR|nr:hypothetical protein PGT21_014885 [Puccinia graminis f. sp. tritici]